MSGRQNRPDAPTVRSRAVAPLSTPPGRHRRTEVPPLPRLQVRRKLAKALLGWHATNGRDFAWRRCPSPYQVLVSEALLQKTTAQRAAVVYDELLAKWPSSSHLAAAPMTKLRRLLAPLGLPVRARRLRDLAVALVRRNGSAPQAESELLSLPGVGPYAARAVRSFAYGHRVAIVDVNVVRVYRRAFGLRANPRNRPPVGVVAFCDALVPRRAAEFNYALLDLGAKVCVAGRPRCSSCPISFACGHALTLEGQKGGDCA